jgi:hypothetical protein
VIKVAKAAPIVPNIGTSRALRIYFKGKVARTTAAGKSNDPSPCIIATIVVIMELRRITKLNIPNTDEPELSSNNMILAGSIMAQRPTDAPTPMTRLIRMAN